MKTNFDGKVISQYEVIRGGKVKETFATYEEAWAYAEKYRGSVVRYYVKKGK